MKIITLLALGLVLLLFGCNPDIEVQEQPIQEQGCMVEEQFSAVSCTMYPNETTCHELPAL